MKNLMHKSKNLKQKQPKLKKKRLNSMKKSTNIFQHLKIKTQLKLYQIRLEVLVYGLALLYALLIGQLLPAIVLLVSFNLIRPETPVTFHFDNVNTCVKVSICMFIISITQLLAIPQNVTMCYGIIIGLAICLVLYKIEYSRIKAIDFKNCTKEQVIEICNTLGYNKFKQDLAIMFFRRQIIKQRSLGNIMQHTEKC